MIQSNNIKKDMEEKIKKDVVEYFNDKFPTFKTNINQLISCNNNLEFSLWGDFKTREGEKNDFKILVQKNNAENKDAIIYTVVDKTIDSSSMKEIKGGINEIGEEIFLAKIRDLLFSNDCKENKDCDKINGFTIEFVVGKYDDLKEDITKSNKPDVPN